MQNSLSSLEAAIANTMALVLWFTKTSSTCTYSHHSPLVSNSTGIRHQVCIPAFHHTGMCPPFICLHRMWMCGFPFKFCFFTCHPPPFSLLCSVASVYPFMKLDDRNCWSLEMPSLEFLQAHPVLCLDSCPLIPPSCPYLHHPPWALVPFNNNVNPVLWDIISKLFQWQVLDKSRKENFCFFFIFRTWFTKVFLLPSSTLKF